MARDFITEITRCYPISNQIMIQTSNEPANLRDWCDTVEDFEVASKRGLELRYDGLLTYEKTSKRWLGCREITTGVFEWSSLNGTPTQPVPATKIKLCHEVHQLAPSGTVKITVSFEPANATEKDFTVELKKSDGNTTASTYDKVTGIFTAASTEEIVKMKVSLVAEPTIFAETSIDITERAHGLYTTMSDADLNIIPANHTYSFDSNGTLNVTQGTTAMSAVTFKPEIRAIEFNQRRTMMVVFGAKAGNNWIACPLNNSTVRPGSVTMVKTNGTFENLIIMPTTTPVYPDNTLVTATLDIENNNKLIVYVKKPSDLAYQIGFEIDLSDTRLIGNAEAKDLIENYSTLGLGSVSDHSTHALAVNMKKITKNPDTTKKINSVKLKKKI